MRLVMVDVMCRSLFVLEYATRDFLALSIHVCT
jgi:hypothetical protein